MIDLGIILFDTFRDFFFVEPNKVEPMGDFKVDIDFIKQKDEPTELVIKNDSFDVNAIEEYKGEAVSKFEFRPRTLDEFIGQEDSKGKALTMMKKVKRGMRGHFLIDGIQGHGKTTFVHIMANEMKAKLIERVGKQIDVKNLIDIINEINNSTEENVILFIDEFDSMDWKTIKVLNPIIESFEIAGKKIKPFIFVGATINKHILLTKNPDTLDRIPIKMKFERYNADEMKRILAQYKEQLYKQDIVSKDVFNTISINCKFNPRNAIALLEEYIVERDINKVLVNYKIVRDGLTAKDIEILKALEGSKRPMGANALAMRVKLSEKEYTTEYEPFLVEYGYVNRIPSRVISEKGINFLKGV